MGDRVGGCSLDAPAFRYTGQPIHILAGHEDQPAGFVAMQITVPAHFAEPSRTRTTHSTRRSTCCATVCWWTRMISRKTQPPSPCSSLPGQRYGWLGSDHLALREDHGGGVSCGASTCNSRRGSPRWGHSIPPMAGNSRSQHPLALTIQ